MASQAAFSAEAGRGMTHVSRDVTQTRAAVHPLILAALATDFLTPLLIWKGVLPAEIRYLSHAAVLLMLFLIGFRFLTTFWLPRAVWIALFVSSFSAFIAIQYGQSLKATAWGLWVMFQFPLVGLFAYLYPGNLQRLATVALKFCIGMMVVQVIVQIGQYLLGQEPGDDLAGLFGFHGTSDLVVFILLVYCLALGRWLYNNEIKPIIAVLILGSVSSGLGEMKLFPVAFLVLSTAAIAVLVLQGRKIHQSVPLGIITAAMLFFALIAYDRIIYQGTPNGSITQYLDSRNLNKYLGQAYREQSSAVADMGRNYAVMRGWQAIRKDNLTLLFGFGIGARGESQTLGSAGKVMQDERMAYISGTGLIILLQELGLMGLLFVAASLFGILHALFRAAQRNEGSPTQQLCYALLLFSLLWPLWLWYCSALTLRVPMLLYWSMLGFVLSDATNRQMSSSSDQQSVGWQG